MKKILILNGPNLNLLGKREPEVYGNKDFNSFFEDLAVLYKNKIILSHIQSNIEGEIISKLHEAGYHSNYKGIIINAGAYTHTSIALADAIAAITTPVLEVHISNIYQREKFRKKSYLAPYCCGTISGLGLESYRLAVEFFINKTH